MKNKIVERFEIVPHTNTLKRVVEKLEGKENSLNESIISRSEEFNVETPRELALIKEIVNLRRDVDRLKNQVDFLKVKNV